ncbi:MlaD family protein [Tenuifilum thalassicum]|uniref:MCE family protein n=1 Tax=Tenuifilum thalassicum TaxID=2590900 RepID=A0A7D4BRP0_9BACT|nr:MlaD family protein [Tenuifilum thalassicum]QKG79741.1 MCE family protein [Tenuifilum thalassicum]
MKVRISRELKIGIFVLSCLLASYWGINFLKGKNIFSPNVEYYAIFKSVDGLQSTDAVLINGFKVGLVKNIEFHDLNSGRFRVTLLVNKKYRLPRNTTAKLVSTDIMGGKAIKLEVSPDSSYFTPGDTLPTSIEIGLIDQLAYQMSPIKEKAETMMVELSKTLVVLQKVLNEQNQENISESIKNLNTTLKHISMLTAGLDTMINSPDGSIKKSMNNIASITSNLRINNKLITNSLKNISNISDSLSKANIPATVAKLDSSLSQLRYVMTKIKSGEGTLGKLVNNDTLYNNLESASLQLDLLIKDMKTNPKRYVNFSVIDLSRTKYIEEKK